MMSLPSDAAPVCAPHDLAKFHYNQALELEKQLRSLLQVKGPFEPSVRSLLNSVRERYESVILEDHELAESHEVEQAVWRLHYKQIDEFRAKIKRITVAASAPIIPGFKSGMQRDSVHKILSAFKSFLAEATGFYHNLVLKLRTKHGLSQDYSSFVDSDCAALANDDSKRRAQVRRCQLSCHRCLIFLGDLARYKEMHGNVQDARSIDFSVAAGYYLQAASLWPASGNPHNQLAVLATYVSDEMLAVYRYCRSLAVETPFLTARDNLILLFEKNRLNYSQLHALKSAVPEGGSHVSATGMAVRGDRILPLGSGTVKLATKDVKSENAGVIANSSERAELRRNFCTRFVRMNGLLFTRTSLETFPQVYSETLSDLEQLLAGHDSNLEASLGTDHQNGTSMSDAGPSIVIQLVAILIFTVHNIDWSLDATNHPTYAEILQRSDLLQHALTAAFECVGRLMHRCSQSKDPARNVLLPALLLFMEWLAGRPEMAIGNQLDKDQANARSSFWAECLVLLNYSLSMFTDGKIDFGFEEAITAFGAPVAIERGVALWEDFELQGFIPLAPAQTALDFSKGSFREETGDRQFQARMKRLLIAGKAVANALEGTHRGICYDEGLNRFLLAGEARLEKMEVEHVTIDKKNIDRLVEEEIDGGIALQNNFPARDSHLMAGKSIVNSLKVTNEEDDDELIVFKPLSKERPPVLHGTEPLYSDNLVPPFNYSVLPSSEVCVQTIAMPSNTGNNSWLSESLLDVHSCPAATKVQETSHVSQRPVQYFSMDGSYLLDASVIMASSKSGLVDLVIPGPLMSVTGPLMVSTSLVSDVSATLSSLYLSCPNTLRSESHVARSCDFLNMTSSVTSLGNWLDQLTDASQYTSSSAEAWLGGQKSVFMSFPDKRVGASGAVVSQCQNEARSLWSSACQPLDRNGLSGFVPSGISKDCLGVEIALNSTSIPVLTTLEAGSSFESEKYSVASNQVATETTSSSWKEKKHPVLNRVGHPAMRPPPGFGPVPRKSVAGPMLRTSQGVIQPSSTERPSQRLNAGEDSIDDYGWLNDYRIAKPVASQSEYSGGRELQLSVSSRNVWSASDVTSRRAGFESAPFPFPGMGALRQRTFSNMIPRYLQAHPSCSEIQHTYSEGQKIIDGGKVLAEQPHHQPEQLMLFEHQQQQYQQQQRRHFHSHDPFVS